jgi:hypothetical protein
VANTLEAVFNASSGRVPIVRRGGGADDEPDPVPRQAGCDQGPARGTRIAAEELIPGADALCRLFQEMGLHQEEWAVYRRAMACHPSVETGDVPPQPSARQAAIRPSTSREP